MKESFARYVSKHRLRPWHLALCVLLVGWVPSLLLAYFSSRVLGRTLENKIMDDARELVGSLAQHVENELERTGGTLDYYRTHPGTLNVLLPPIAPAVDPRASPSPAAFPAASSPVRRPRPGTTTTLPASPVPSSPLPVASPPPSAQDWLAGVFAVQQVNRIDGMFLADATGHVLTSLPPSVHDQPAPNLADAPWRTTAERAAGADPESGPHYTVTPVYPRASDGRPVVSVLVAVRDKGSPNLLGYLGAEILVERMGRRLQAIERGSSANTRLQIIDAAGRPLFTPKLEPNPPEVAPVDPALLRVYRHDQQGVEESGGTLHVFDVMQPTGWIAVMDRPADLLLRPVHELLRRTFFLVGCLVVGTTFAAVLLASFHRRQLLSSLRTQREQIFNEKILANMPVGIALVDPAGERFLHVNSAFVEVVHSLGHLPREADVRTAMFADVAVATREALARVLHFGVPFQAVEQRTATAAGPVRFLTTNLLRLQDSEQRTIGVLCLIEDATAAVNLRQELINANTAKDQFLAQLSHELRNPLSPVITMVAELEVFADALPAAREPLEIIRRNVELEARLIDDLLDVTRISSGKLQLSTQTVDVHRMMTLALEICQREIEDKELRLELELRARDHFAVADPARLQQVFWNLLKNAVKFTPAGRRIVVRSSNHIATPGAVPSLARNAASAHVVFAKMPNASGKTTAANGAPAAATAPAGPVGFLRIEVCDEGIGIEPQHLRRIFNAFDQGQSSITQRFGGLGLGLAISKAMVEAHGGSLSVSSEGANKGATFTVDLHTCPTPAEEGAENSGGEPAAMLAATAVPASPAAAQGAQNGGARVSAPGGGQRVLLVDDHEDTCLGMQRLLNRRGYRVTVAHSVAEGLAKAEKEERFDLLISDLGLPDGSGCDLMTALRTRGGPPGIALSGYGMESDIDKTREAGFSEHLIKPVAIDRLEEAMRRLLA